jgi:PGF-pre-PGF domain-containing protein
MGGTSIEYDLSGTGSPVIGISFDAKDNEGVVVTKVQVLSDSPEGITNPPGNPYQMMSIDVGSQGTISSHNADNIMINFRVSWEWIRENNIDPVTIRMTRYHDGEWQELPTGRVSDDGEYLYFAAETTGFSIFSIVGDELVLATEGEADVPQAFTEEATEVPASTEDKSTPGFTAEIGLVFLSLAFLAGRKYGR